MFEYILITMIEEFCVLDWWVCGWEGDNILSIIIKMRQTFSIFDVDRIIKKNIHTPVLLRMLTRTYFVIILGVDYLIFVIGVEFSDTIEISDGMRKIRDFPRIVDIQFCPVL